MTWSSDWAPFGAKVLGKKEVREVLLQLGAANGYVYYMCMVDRARDLYTNVSCPDVQCFGSQGSADIPPALVVRRRAQAFG